MLEACFFLYLLVLFLNPNFFFYYVQVFLNPNFLFNYFAFTARVGFDRLFFLNKLLVFARQQYEIIFQFVINKFVLFILQSLENFLLLFSHLVDLVIDVGNPRRSFIVLSSKHYVGISDFPVVSYVLVIVVSVNWKPVLIVELHLDILAYFKLFGAHRSVQAQQLFL